MGVDPAERRIAQLDQPVPAFPTAPPPGPPARPGAVPGGDVLEVATRPPLLEVRRVCKAFTRAGAGGRVTAAVDISFQLAAGEILVLLGPSGCGKTTLLRCIAGLERPDAGEILVDRQVVFSSLRRTNVSPDRRPISMVFQSYALWPHMTAVDNVAFPLRARRMRRAEARQRALDALRLVGLEEIAQQYPAHLSGGQQQRVSLARALVGDSRLILFDEPLSNIDARVRADLRVEIAELQRALGFAAVYVTHDQSEALALAHRIAVMERGSVVQMGPPQVVYNAPSSAYVAEFVGGANLVSGAAQRWGDGRVVVSTPIGQLVATAVDPIAEGAAVTVAFRPEACTLVDDATGGENTIRGRVKVCLFAGARTELAVDVDGVEISALASPRAAIAEDSQVTLRVAAADVRAFAVRSDVPSSPDAQA